MRDEIVGQLDTHEIAAAFAQLDSDDALYLIEDLDDEERREVLDAVPAADRVWAEQSLSYPEHSAGRLMQRELVSIPAYWTVGQTIDYLRSAADLPDEFYDLYIVDTDHVPAGYVPLSRAMRTRRPVLISDIMDPDPRVIQAELDQEDVAYMFEQYDLVSAPVVDDAGRLIGVITVDDVVEVIGEEAEEDIMYLGGVSVTDLHEPAWRTTRRRFVWLLVNLATAILASMVIGLFDASIEQMVALAVLMPIVASMGGKRGHPDFDGDGSRVGHQGRHAGQRAAPDRQGGCCRFRQRHPVRDHHGRRHDLLVRPADARRRDRRGDGRQHGGRRDCRAS